MKYNPSKIEKRWQRYWEKKKLYRGDDNSDKPKYYQLETFPYPSAAGLHVGHPKGYIAEDIHARFMRMNGREVLYTMGWDAFGLPTENYAIKVGKSPQEVATENIKNFTRQVKMFGLSYDWDREINTSSSQYYRWTQWLFLKLYEKGLAYKALSKVNWCPKDQTVLANEQVVDGRCDRCGELVIQKEMEQWFFRITDYAERLLGELKDLDWPAATIKRQEDWIGKSAGAELSFQISNSKIQIKIFTTRPDTLFGATYLVVAPEHPFVVSLLTSKDQTFNVKNIEEVKKYVEATSRKTELMRQEDAKDKTGVELKGITALNPATKEKIPVWIADYVLGNYGTGAVMGVPANDERDFEFAQKFNLPIREVIMPVVIDHVNPPRSDKPTVTRKNIHVVVYDPKKQAYLTLHSEKFNWNTVIMGGLEEGENLEQAARREVQEETGYTDLVFKRILGGPVQASYFAKHKDENRVAIAQAAYFELASETKVERTDTEAGEIIWVSAKEFVPGILVNSELPFWLDRLHSSKPVYVGRGILINSGDFTGRDSEEAKWQITELVGGEKKTQFKLRDWSVSRQRYWGVPIPIIECSTCGSVPVPEQDLPVKLPELKDYRPQGMPPLASSAKFMKAECPKCGGAAQRAPETLDTFVDSSWYYLRYTDPHNDKEFASKTKLQHWLPVDLYVIGAEHTVLHLLYSRFITKFLQDQKYLDFTEPFLKLRHVGLIQGSDGQKMSKSRGNVVNPDEVVEQYGADTVRLYEMFMGPFEQGQPWDPKGINGVSRFLNRVWKVANGKWQMANGKNLDQILNSTIKKVGEDIEELKFNTAVSELMKLLNAMEDSGATQKQFETFIKLIAPFAPHIAEEIWSRLFSNSDLKEKSRILDSWSESGQVSDSYQSIHRQPWPQYDETMLQEQTVQIAIQINGKVRDVITITADAPEEEVKSKALASEKIIKNLAQSKIKKTIYVKNKVLNLIA